MTSRAARESGSPARAVSATATVSVAPRLIEGPSMKRSRVQRLQGTSAALDGRLGAVSVDRKGPDSAKTSRPVAAGAPGTRRGGQGRDPTAPAAPATATV